MSRRKNKVKDYRTQVISAPEAALLLRMPERSFFRLVETGTIPKSSDGEYILGEVKDLADYDGRRITSTAAILE